MSQFINRLKKAAAVSVMGVSSLSFVPAAAPVAIVAVVAGTSLTPSTSHAMVVWDPTNFVQNLITATNSVLTEANTYATMVQSTKQTMQMARSVTNLNGLADLAGLSDELALYQELASTSMQLYGSLQQARDVYQGLQSTFGAANFTWKEFLQGQSTYQTSRVNNLLSQFQTANRSIEKVSQRRARLLEKAQEAGANESMMQISQVVSGQLDMIAGQNQQIAGMMADKLAAEAATEQDRIKAQDFFNDVNRTRQQKMYDAANGIN